MVRLLTAWATSCAAWTLLVFMATPAHAGAAADDASDAAVAWLADQRVSSLSLPDRIDLALAYQVGGASRRQITPLINDIEFVVNRRASMDTDVLSRAIVVLDIAGRPLVVGGSRRDLVRELSDSVGKAPSAPGEFDAVPGREVAAQAWGILAELRVGRTPKAETSFLISQQCPDGHLVAAPTIQTCSQSVDLQDQSLAFAAVVAASRRGLSTADAVPRLASFLQGLKQSDVPASAAALLVHPLRDIGEADLAAKTRSRLQSLQLTSSTAIDDRQIGAIGGETDTLVKDLLQRRLDPAPALTAAAVLGLRPVDLTRYRYAPRSALRKAPRPGLSVIGPGSTAPGRPVSLLVQNAAPGEEVSLQAQGASGVVATSTASPKGVATIGFSARRSASPGQQLRVTTPRGESATITLNVVQPLTEKRDSSSTTAAAGSQPLELTLTQALLAAGALLVILLVGARLLRQE